MINDMKKGFKLAAFISIFCCTSSAFISAPKPLPALSTFHKRTGLLSSSTKASDGDDDVKNDGAQFLLKEIEGLTMTFQEVQKTIRSNAKLYESKLSEYEDHMDRLSNDISLANTVILQKELELEDIQKAKASQKMMEEDLSSKRKEIEVLTQQTQEKQILLAEKEEEMTSLREDLKTLTSNYESLQKEVEVQSDLLKSTRADNESLLGQVSNLQTQVEEATRLSQSMKADHESQMNTLKEQMTKETTTTREQDTYQLNEAQQETERLKRTLSSVREELAQAISQAADDKSTLESKVQNLQRELRENNPNVQDVQLRKELIDVRAKSYKDLMDVRLKMTSSVDEVQQLSQKMKKYEDERRSLRKLTFLGIKRVLALVTFGIIGGDSRKKRERREERKQKPKVKVFNAKRTKLGV